METHPLSVSDAIALINQTLDYAYPTIVVEGEVSGFKVNQGKFVFFDLKDESGTLSCFLMLFSLRTAVEDGMRVRVVAQPKVTQWGKFSLTVREVQPVGEGSLKRAFVLLREKLTREGLFDPARKRPLPMFPTRLAVISSTQAAGYADFIKILGERWGGVAVSVAHVTVQGETAARQIVRALQYFNEQTELADVIVVLRGGGSLDDLSAFNDEPLARAIAASRVPVLTGIGHEVDTTLADLAADVRAATPSNAAELVVPDKASIRLLVRRDVATMSERYMRYLEDTQGMLGTTLHSMFDRMEQRLTALFARYEQGAAVLSQLDPNTVLRRGYGIVRSDAGKVISWATVGEQIHIETKRSIMKAEVVNVKNK